MFVKKAAEFFKLFLWASVGGFLGKTGSTYFFYRKNPGLPELVGRPWYAELKIPLLFTAAAVLVCILVRILLKKAMQKHAEE